MKELDKCTRLTRAVENMIVIVQYKLSQPHRLTIFIRDVMIKLV